ncbi:hypothetical protein EG329_007954 [Mollisiaceae sp. DMI_Dod_QoI]|nr:hypothetical protein EG329_007954 [Helotiales sp. DMI_Dod_QoI]
MVAITQVITHILFPLYFYPAPAAWQPLYTSLATYPNVTFDVVINPDSGPGSMTYPDANFITAITKLNTYPNANLLGYVHTSYAARNLTTVKSEIQQYADWSNYTKSNIQLHGIFFDEAPDAYTTQAYQYMSNCSSYAKSLSLPTIVFNPGTPPATQYYSIATYLVTFEDYASAFTTTSITDIPSKYRNQSVFILHDLNATTMNQASIVKNMISYGVGGMFVTTVEYDGFSALWTQFVELIAGAA